MKSKPNFKADLNLQVDKAKNLSKHNPRWELVPPVMPVTGPRCYERWAHFFGGLVDGDGHINKLGYLVIAFDGASYATACRVAQRVGYGRVSRVKGKRAYTYVLSQRPGRIWVGRALAH